MNRPHRPGHLGRRLSRAAGPMLEQIRAGDSRWSRVLRRAANRLRPAVDTAVREAQAATDRRDWPEAVRLWGDLVGRYAMIAPAKAWARLAVAHRELGDTATAEAILREAVERFPDDLGLTMESAQLAMVREDWEAAVERWSDVLARFPTEAPSKAYARHAIAHRELGLHDVAAALLDRAHVRFPEDVDLAMEWAQFAMVTEDWPEAVRRWTDLTARFDDRVPARAKARLAQSYRELGELDTAEEVLAQARSEVPGDLMIENERAQLSLAREDWAEALVRWDALVESFEADLPAKAFAQIGVVHRRLGDHGAATQVIERGLRRHPHDTRLMGEWAQLAMVAQDWPEAVNRWHQVLELRNAETGQEGEMTRFPRTGSAVDWYELAWQEIVHSWDQIVPQLSDPPTAHLYRALGRTLTDAELPRDAERILSRGVEEFPADAGLAFDHVEATLLLSHGPGRAADATALREVAARVAGTPEVSSQCRDLADARDGRRSAVHAQLDALLATHAPDAGHPGGLDRLHLLRVPRESSLELHVRAGRFYSAAILRARVREVSERDQWPEMRATRNLGLARAREVAAAYGRRFEDLPYLPCEVLEDALLFPLYHEIVLHEPMMRVAADIAAENDPSPVYIQTRTLTFRYLDGYSFSNFDVLYLYFELRRLGVNAVLCRFESPVGSGDADDESPSVRQSLARIRVLPSARAMLPRGEVRRPDHHTHEAAIIPAGMRSIGRMTQATGPALMYASGSIVKEFAYDRSFKQAFPVEPQATIHPHAEHMASYAFELWPTEHIEATVLTHGGVPAAGTLEVTAPVGGDWLGWLDAAMHDFLRELSLRSFAEVGARGIRTVHVCDHLFTESVLFAHAVKQRGGRVILWPHSANPVHVDERRPEQFDEVHAVTRAGADQWRTRFPSHVIHHSPRLMLDPPAPDVAHDPRAPLSVVVLGGRSVLRHMPTMDQAAHEGSYRAFFQGIEKLQTDHPIDVWFKPRGLTGEHEMWLHQTVGGTAGWRRVLQHPMRMQLPNPIFVSISMGTSALLEGLARGIPGMVVRDFPVRDYTTIDADAFPTLPTEQALELVATCADGAGWRELLERETAYYDAELFAAG